MKTARLLAFFLVIASTAIGLIACRARQAAPPPVRFQDAGDPVPIRTDAAVTAVEDDGQQLARRLRDLEYPELRRRDPREIAVLQRRVDARESLYKMVRTMYDQGVRGGRGIDVATAGYHLAIARADLAWARQNVHEAVSRLGEAVDFAADTVRIATGLYEQGIGPMTPVLEAQSLLADAELALLRAEQVAAVARVDISDIEIDPLKRAEKRASQEPEVELLPPGRDVPTPPEVEPFPALRLDPLPVRPPEPSPERQPEPAPSGLPRIRIEDIPGPDPLPVPQLEPAPARPHEKEEERPRLPSPPST